MRDQLRCDRCGKFCRWDGDTRAVGGLTCFDDYFGLGREPETVCYRCLGYDLPFDHPEFTPRDESDDEPDKVAAA